MKRSLLRMSAAVMAGFSVLALIGLMAGCSGGGGGGDGGAAPDSAGAVATYSISGSVTSSGTGMSGIAVALSGGGSATTTTDSSGHYSFANLANGSYTVTPTVTAGYYCSPASRTKIVDGADVSDVNFAAQVQTYSISGSVTASGTGMSGIAVALSGGGSATTNTDSSGNYTFANLANGSYTVTPTVTAGYYCSPASRTQTVNGANISNVNFTAAEAQTYSISGSVTASGVGKPGVSVALTGTISATISTDSSGNYIFSGLTNGDYTVTPATTGYTFTPSFITKTVNGANVSGVNFTAATSANIPTIYVIDDTGHIGTINVTNGDVQVIGDTGVVLTDIAFDANGVLYGVSTDKLYKINKSTGASTLVGSLGITDATSLEFNKGGSILYTANNSLHTVNITTGATTAITSSEGFPFSSSGDLTSIGDNFYLTSKIPGDVNNCNLVSLNTSTGTGTLVGAIGFPNVFGLATNDNVHLFGFSKGNLISINTTTGVGTLVKDISGKGLSNINGASSN